MCSSVLELCIYQSVGLLAIFLAVVVRLAASALAGHHTSSYKFPPFTSHNAPSQVLSRYVFIINK